MLSLDGPQYHKRYMHRWHLCCCSIVSLPKLKCEVAYRSYTALPVCLLLLSPLQTPLPLLLHFIQTLIAGAIHVDGGVGSLYMGADDAQTALQQLEQPTVSSGSSSGGSLRVSATTLDDVYYPLIAQKGKTAPSGQFNYLNIH
jgi:hypothetical protein